MLRRATITLGIGPHSSFECFSQKRLTINVTLLSLYTESYRKLECGPMPNVMVALPNIGGALCSTPQSLADAH